MLDKTTAYGLDFLFPGGDDTIGASLRKHGEFARPELDLLLAYSTAASGTFIDVGANIGAIGLPFAKSRPTWRVVAIEAHRGLANILAANTLNNALWNVEPFHAAAGATMGLVNFPAPGLTQHANYGTLSLTRIGGALEPTRMIRLDDLAPKSTALVKIDVEGYEPEVLKGAVKLLADIRPVWLAEAGQKSPEENESTITTFLDAGYSVFWFWAPFVTPGAERGEPENIHRGDTNVLALPRGVPNLWDLAPVTSPDAPRPSSARELPYLARYGYGLK